MRNFQRKRGWTNVLYSKPVLIFLGILVLFFAWNVFGFMGKMEITRENRKLAENKVTELEREKAKLSADIARLGTEKGIEETIRDKFGLVKEGEGLIIVIEDKNAPQIEIEENTGGIFSMFYFWKNWFK
ncbi:MAG: septum formation initiator family protein [Candidatus Curtissbacteria bacterium]